jgi:hypothetical protein
VAPGDHAPAGLRLERWFTDADEPFAVTLVRSIGHDPGV